MQQINSTRGGGEEEEETEEDAEEEGVEEDGETDAKRNGERENTMWEYETSMSVSRVEKSELNVI